MKIGLFWRQVSNLLLNEKESNICCIFISCLRHGELPGNRLLYLWNALKQQDVVRYLTHPQDARMPRELEPKTATHIFTKRKCSNSVSFRMEDRTSVVNVTPPWRKTFDFKMMQEDITFGQECFRKAILVVGLFLNCTVLLVVSCSRQLRYPRHIFWAVISFFECLFLIQCALELAIVFNQDQLACQIFIVLAPVVYSILLLILSMAALDRYLAIVRYEWYKKSVTNCGVITVISFASFLSFVVITIPFWTGNQSIHTCSTNWVDMYWVLLWDLSLGVTCVILHFKIFYESRTLIQQYLPNYHQQSVTVKFVNSRSGNSNFGNTLFSKHFIDFLCSVVKSHRDL